MRISGNDGRCRYLHAPGTQTDRSAFAKLMRTCGIELPDSLPLERIVALGWVAPVLRVRLPETAFLSWSDYPNLSMNGFDECPEGDRWALDLYTRTMSSPPPVNRDDWWVFFLDDSSDSVAQAARDHALDPAKCDGLPLAFRHPRHNQEIRPWLDYFAYWQIFELADFLFSMTCTLPLTDDLADVIERSGGVWLELADVRVQALKRKWESRRPTFEWLSRMRTVLGSSMTPDRSQDEIDVALGAVAKGLKLTYDQMRSDIRNTLLVMWRDWTGQSSPITRRHSSLLELLRQEIQYSVFYLERLTGQPPDFFDSFWHGGRQEHEWACLIEALPREEELARRDFARTALMYLRRYKASIPQIGTLNEEGFRRLVSDNWQRSRPLRRFVLAFYRLHRELNGERLIENESVIGRAERIEQFNLTLMHAERVLSLEYRERHRLQSYPEIRKLAKDTLNHLLCRWSLSGEVSRIAQKRTQLLLQQHAMLHDLDPQQGLPLVSSSDVASGNDTADHAAAMLINFVIARNYAAHHDAVDADLVYPNGEDADKHPGEIAVTSALAAVAAALLEH